MQADNNGRTVFEDLLMQNTVLKVRHKNHYGSDFYYPDNELAHKFLKLINANQNLETLSENHLNILESDFGVVVEYAVHKRNVRGV